MKSKGMHAHSYLAGQPMPATGPRARPAGLQSKRADLLRCLMREPTVSRSVALVR